MTEHTHGDYYVGLEFFHFCVASGTKLIHYYFFACHDLTNASKENIKDRV